MPPYTTLVVRVFYVFLKGGNLPVLVTTAQLLYTSETTEKARELSESHEVYSQSVCVFTNSLSRGSTSQRKEKKKKTDYATVVVELLLWRGVCRFSNCSGAMQVRKKKKTKYI